uniref:Putative salivary kunitz domain protein n=1 Tax=Ixodes ricinus TaxID=34613 RepID=A0A6B0UTC4_IXORI
MQKILQFIFVVSFAILACRASSKKGMPDRCFPPEQDPRCRSHCGRHFYDEDTKACKLSFGCWDGNAGYYEEEECQRNCKGLPDQCFPPEEDPRCRAHSGRHFYDEDTKACKLHYGCWNGDQGYYEEEECKRNCEVNTK